MEEYKQINRKELLSALVKRFGAVEVARYYLSDAISDMNSMSVGMAENNPLLAAKGFDSLNNNLMMIRTLLENKDYKPSLEKNIRDELEK